MLSTKEPKEYIKQILNLTAVQDTLYPLCAPSEIYALTEAVGTSLSEYEISSLLNPMNEIIKGRLFLGRRPIVYSPDLPEIVERIKKPSTAYKCKNLCMLLTYIEQDSCQSNLWCISPTAGVRNSSHPIKSVKCLEGDSYYRPNFLCHSANKVHNSWNKNFNELYYMTINGKIRKAPKVSYYQLPHDAYSNLMVDFYQKSDTNSSIKDNVRYLIYWKDII